MRTWIFILFFYCIFLLYPIHTYDNIVDFQKYQSYYTWLTFAIYNHADTISKQQKVSIDEIFAIIQSESQGNAMAISYANARGLMQVLPLHHSGPASDLFDVNLNLTKGSSFYKWCITYTNGNKREALRIYNSGPFSSRAAYTNWNYVETILKNAYITARLENKFYRSF